MPPSPSQTLPLGGADPLAKSSVRSLMAETRERTLALVENVSDENVERVHDPLMSPLAWDLGHIAAFEDLWLGVRVGGGRPLRPDLMEVYDATETPRAERGALPYLRRAEALAYMDAVRERALDVLDGADVGPDAAPLTRAGFVFELMLGHEQQHNETMLQTLSLAPAGAFEPARRPARVPVEAVSGMVRIEGGEAALGAGDGGFAYDNERPRHARALAAFEIDRAPVTNAEYREFVDAGGYRRRDWWSDPGWRWLQESGVERPLHWTDDDRVRRFERTDPIDPAEPVEHVSWFEADAFARSRAKRLPTEAEWERAAGGGRHPWGEAAPTPEHANLDQTAFGPEAPGAYPKGDSAAGVSALIGDVWEWTASDFEPYPGFRAFPYEDYSAIFFGRDHKVLRGGSWATRPRVIRTSFRNWDLPQRRQIFAGFRCARDAT